MNFTTERDVELLPGHALEEIEQLRTVVVRYCDRSRMATVYPQSLQQVIDRAFETTKKEG